MLKAVLFDLDGTLLPMNENEFIKQYFELMCKKLAPLGYSSNELVETIMEGTKAMIKNDGKNTNEQIFWRCFTNHYGNEKLCDKSHFDDFYLKEFLNVRNCCGENELARDVINFVKSQNLKIILASNPLFPSNGMLARLGFIKLNKNDFNYITSYEVAHYAKPNPKYYQEILDINHLKSNEVIYFGNSETEDYEPASRVGIKTYLVTNGTIKNEKQILFNEIKATIMKEINQ